MPFPGQNQRGIHSTLLAPTPYAVWKGFNKALIRFTKQRMRTPTCKRKTRQTNVGRNIWRQDHSLGPGLVRFALFNLASWFNAGNTVCETFTTKVRSVHTAAALIKNAKPIPIRTNKFPRTTYTRKITSIRLRSSAKRKKTSAANFAKTTTYTRDF